MGVSGILGVEPSRHLRFALPGREPPFVVDASSAPYLAVRKNEDHRDRDRDDDPFGGVERREV
jgi:hypothetical protein